MRIKVSHQPKTKEIPVVVENQMNACSTEEHVEGTMSSDTETEEALSRPQCITILSSNDHLATICNTNIFIQSAIISPFLSPLGKSNFSGVYFLG